MFRHNHCMLPGQRPQKHTRVIHGNATLVNADVPPPPSATADMGRVRAGVAAGVAQLAPDDTDTPVRVTHAKLPQFDPTGTSEGIWEIRNGIDPSTGEGLLVVSGDGVSTIQTFQIFVKPKAQIRGKAFTSHMDYSAANLTDGLIVGKDVTGNLFDGATLDGATITSNASLRDKFAGETVMERNSFRGASLRGTKISSLLLRENDFTGADMTGMEFWGWFASDVEWAIDVTDTNFYPDMIGSAGAVEDRGHPQSLHRVKYTRYTLDDVAAHTGMSEDDVAMAVWAGDLEIRDNETLQRVTSGYDKDRHHIPQWALLPLQNT
jgi:hypothetical protein